MSELGAGPSGSNGVEALQLLEHEQGRCPFPLTSAGDPKAKVFVQRGCKIDEFEGKKYPEIFLVQFLLYLFGFGLVCSFFFPQETFFVVCC